MKILVIVHSKTGNTLKFAEKIAEKLKAKGNAVDVVRLETDPPVASGTARQHPPFSITNLPDPESYDAVLAGGPTWAFTASPVIYEAIRQIKDLKDKKAACFTVQAFPFAFMGGNQSVGLMKKELEAKGARVAVTASVQGMFHDMKKDMEKKADEMAVAF